MSKLFTSQPSPLIRTCLLTGLLIGTLGIALVSVQLSLVNAKGASATVIHVDRAPAMSITMASHIDDTPRQLTVTYTLIMRNAVHAGIIRKEKSITFTDTIPLGLSHISVKGNYWHTTVSSSISPSLVTGMYTGYYPVAAGATLPTVIITGTITPHASHVLSNSASVHVPGNADKLHNTATIKDTIGSIVFSQHSLHSSSVSCNKTCDQQSTDNSCNKTCDQQNTDNPCNKTCDQESIQTSLQQRVDITCSRCDQQSTTSSASTSSTVHSTSTPNTPSTVRSASTPSTGRHSPGKGSTDPFPALPNTGSDPHP